MTKEIVLDYNYLESMSGRFENVFAKADTAAQYAEIAERCCDAGVLHKYVVNLSEKIRTSIRLIIDSFTSTDQKMKEEAQNIIGADAYEEIDKKLSYSRNVESNIQNNLDYWLTINDGNAHQIGINGNYPWCDKFANYVITSSGKKCPGNTIGAMFPALAGENLIHGYYAKDGALNDLNDRWSSSISNDGYVPKTGDLVFFNWSGGNYRSVDHVGVIYVDPNDGVTYVVHGNYGDRVQKTRLDSLTKSSDHITVADMTTYNNTH